MLSFSGSTSSLNCSSRRAIPNPCSAPIVCNVFKIITSSVPWSTSTLLLTTLFPLDIATEDSKPPMECPQVSDTVRHPRDAGVFPANIHATRQRLTIADHGTVVSSSALANPVLSGDNRGFCCRQVNLVLGHFYGRPCYSCESDSQ